MSDEAAFLETLRANPADDTTRLVYADWLEERDRAPEAEYLRLTATLTREVDDPTRLAERTARIGLLGNDLTEEWRSAAGGRFDLTFVNHERAQMISAVKAVRDLTGASLAEMKAFFYTLPQRIFGGLPFDSAVSFRDYLLTQVSSADVRITASEQAASPYPTLYEVRASVCLHVHPTRDDPAARARAVSSFRTFLAASLVAPEIAEAAKLGHDVAVATGLSPLALVPRLAELRKRAATLCDTTSWTFSIRVTPTR